MAHSFISYLGEHLMKCFSKAILFLEKKSASEILKIYLKTLVYKWNDWLYNRYLHVFICHKVTTFGGSISFLKHYNAICTVVIYRIYYILILNANH